MALTKEIKKDIIVQYGGSDKNTGSSEVQVALLTKHINDLTGHLSTNPKDNHSRYGLLKMVEKRKRLLRYITNNDIEKYRALIQKLGIRK